MRFRLGVIPFGISSCLAFIAPAFPTLQTLDTQHDRGAGVATTLTATRIYKVPSAFDVLRESSDGLLQPLHPLELRG